MFVEEIVSNLIRKAVIDEAIFIHWINDTKEYQYAVQFLMTHQ